MKSAIYDSLWPPNAAKGARDNALWVLRTNTATLMNFTLMGYHVRPGDYKAVETALVNGNIYVDIDYGTVSKGEYQSTNHTVNGETYSGRFILGSSTCFMSQATQWALFIHEATHAAMDLRSKSSMSILHSECLAYFAQQLYYQRATGGDYIADNGGHKFECARKCVEKFLKDGWVDDQSTTMLKAAIMGDSDYGWGSVYVKADYRG